MITKTLAPKEFADDATEDIGFLGGTPKPHSQIINDRFRILSELGRGGMAVVHLAEDLSSGKRVALNNKTKKDRHSDWLVWSIW